MIDRGFPLSSLSAMNATLALQLYFVTNTKCARTRQTGLHAPHIILLSNLKEITSR